MNKKVAFLIIIFILFFIVINVPRDQWSSIPFKNIQFKLSEVKDTVIDYKRSTATTKVIDYEVYAEVTEKWFLGKESISNFSIRMLDDKDKYISAFLSMGYDFKRGVIFGHAHSVNTEGYFYIGKGKIVDGILKPIFLKGTVFYFNPKAECGEFHCHGIQVVLPYSFEELKRIFKQEAMQH